MAVFFVVKRDSYPPFTTLIEEPAEEVATKERCLNQASCSWNSAHWIRSLELHFTEIVSVGPSTFSILVKIPVMGSLMLSSVILIPKKVLKKEGFARIQGVSLLSNHNPDF